MIIRKAEKGKDELAILEGAKDFASRTKFSHLLPKENDEWVASLSNIMNSPIVDITVAEHNNIVVGGIGLVYNAWIWNPKVIIGEELFWWTAKSAPFRTAVLLIQQVMGEIDEKGAIPMFKSLSTSPKGVNRMYEKYNMEHTENTFMRVKWL